MAHICSLNPKYTTQRHFDWHVLTTNIYVRLSFASLPTPPLSSPTFPALKHKIKTNRKQTRSKLVEWNPCPLSWKKSRMTESLFSSAECLDFTKPSVWCPFLSCRSRHVCPLAGGTARSILWIKHGAGFGRGVAGGPYVWAKTSQSVEKRSPAEGSGARPPVTLGRRDRSGRLWIWDFSSFLTWVTLASFCLYSCKGGDDTANVWAKMNNLFRN